MKWKAWLHEPLVHFLIAGAALFAFGQWLAPAPLDDRVIAVGRAQVLDHLQARTQIYDEAQFDQLLAKMTDAERAELVRDVAVTEALWREGEALRLSDNDPLVRQRVIQQMRQLLMEEAASDLTVSEADVAAFYQANQPRYASGAAVSFSHVFFAGADGEQRARAALAQLKSGGDPGAVGDRFLYQRTYADAGREEITGQFGEPFAAALFASDPASGPARWIGPLQSTHGWHLVDLRARGAAQVPPLAAIASRVREDALADRRALAIAGALDVMMADYRVETAADLAP